jgi:ATP-dependent Clp protease ATP-binding subunit ClpX
VLKSVVGQSDSKPRLAAAFSHYTAYLEDAGVGKPILCVFGPTGSGKTYSLEMCARAAGLPFSVVGGAGISPAGYKGLTLRDLISQHYMKYRSEEGVVFIDEVDKWCQGSQAQHGQPDREQVALGLSRQGESLRLIEGERIVFTDEAKDWRGLRDEASAHILLPGERAEEDSETSGTPKEFDTGQTFWIFAGAFVGIEAVIASRQGQNQIPSEDIWEHGDPRDFVRYGMMEEFANRISLWAWTKRLTQSEIVEVMELQDRPRWERLFEIMGCELDLDTGAFSACANTAYEQKTGPRGAKGWFQHVMYEVMSQASERHLEHIRVDGHVMHTGRLVL